MPPLMRWLPSTTSLAQIDAVGRGHPPHQTLVSLTDTSNPAKCAMLRFSF
jgi:hypothetical protein